MNWDGDLERALDHIAFVLSVPDGRNSPRRLRVAPEFRSLHGHPRFEALLEEWEGHRF